MMFFLKNNYFKKLEEWHCFTVVHISLLPGLLTNSQWDLMLSALDLMYHRMLGPVLAVTGHHRLRLEAAQPYYLTVSRSRATAFWPVSGEAVLALPRL